MPAFIAKGLMLLLLICFSVAAHAKHGKGGFIIYQYLGAGSTSGTSRYQVTVRHYIDCNSVQLIESEIYLGIFEGSSSTLVKTVTIAKTSQQSLTRTSFNSCINPVPYICFYVVTYVSTIELTDNTDGYTLTEQECCRINGIVNISNSVNYGITNTNTIPGVINGVVYRNNSSPVFIEKDTAVICHNSAFMLEMSAEDSDGDSLSYNFCPALAGASMQNHQPNPPPGPPYYNLPYASGFSATAPLGDQVTIDTRTGIISGIAPSATGTYVLAVCVYEYRNGVLIGMTKKEVHITVADCSLTAASLSEYINCNDYSFTFENGSTSSNISTYAWDFGVTSISSDTSSQPTPKYVYTDTGTYTLKLTVTSTAGCKDSAETSVKVYPGFTPSFTYTGSCYQSPFDFKDASYAKYGTINSWSWNLGDGTTSTDQNITHTYASSGQYTVTFNVSSDKGCTGTVTKQVTANDKPQIILPFTDTLICSIDTLPLIVNTSGSISWSPSYNIIGGNTANPLVYPKDTTVYTVTVQDKQCIDSATVTVNVLDKITVDLGNDITICKTDSVQLTPVTQGLQFLWSPAYGLSSTTVKNPNAAPLVNQQYKLVVNLGKCDASDSIDIKVVDYPTANAGRDTVLCYGQSAILNGSMVGSSFAWSPTAGLTNINTLTPVASPVNTTTYILLVNDTLGCPKAGYDSVVITVIPKINAFAGNDTVVVANQPLQLNASGASYYSWYPSTGMNNPNIADPIVTLSAAYDSIIYTVHVSTAEGCYAEDDIKVKIFKTLPDIFIPTGFTPNADGRNDILKPILVGMKRLDFFDVYNRWGELLFHTTATGAGWDGNRNGTQQPPGTYVFMARGVDYLDKVIIKKGTVVLIR